MISAYKCPGSFGSGTPAIKIKKCPGCGGEVELFAKAQDLQKDEKFTEAIQVYRQIVREFPKTRQAANSQFMIGYVYANHVKDFEQAKTELQRFIDKFGASADSGLVAGATSIDERPPVPWTRRSPMASPKSIQ